MGENMSCKVLLLRLTRRMERGRSSKGIFMTFGKLMSGNTHTEIFFLNRDLFCMVREAYFLQPPPLHGDIHIHRAPWLCHCSNGPTYPPLARGCMQALKLKPNASALTCRAHSTRGAHGCAQTHRTHSWCLTAVPTHSKSQPAPPVNKFALAALSAPHSSTRGHR